MSEELTAPAFWALQSDKLTVEEISTAATVAKSIDTILTRDDASKLVDKFESLFRIHINPLPPWLRSIKLNRRAAMLGARMRKIKVPQIMDELDVSKLSGLTTFVVLCCQYSEEMSSITEIVELLVAGNLGSLVRVQMDQEELGRVFRNLRPHLGALAASSIDADKNSDVSNRAMKWMKELQSFAKLDWAPKELLDRNTRATMHLISELLCGTDLTNEEKNPSDWKTHHREEDQSDQYDQDEGQWAKVHDTLHLTSAHIALAAAAHNASVSVQCVSENDSIILPVHPDPQEQKSTFLVRLWLKQPPDHVHGVLREREGSANDGVNDNLRDKDEKINVFGGVQNIVPWIARQLDFDCRFAPDDKKFEVLLKLWESGTEFGKRIRWEAFSDWGGTLHLQIDEDVLAKYSAQTHTGKQLAKAFVEYRYKRYLSRSTIDPDGHQLRMATIAARATEEMYNSRGLQLPTASRDFYSHPKDERAEAFFSEAQQPRAAMLFFMAAVSIQAVRNMMHPDSDSLDTYALNLFALDDESAVKLSGIFTVITERGIDLTTLLATAASIWGGEKSSIIHKKDTMGAIGIVSPHCTVILDAIREPLSLFRKAGGKRIPPLLSIWRGAVPLIPRDRNTGYVRTTQQYTRRNGHLAGGQDSIPTSPEVDPQGTMLVTFDVLNSAEGTGTFCFWYAGHLVAEFSPYLIITGLVQGFFAPKSGPREFRNMSEGLVESYLGDPYESEGSLNDTIYSVGSSSSDYSTDVERFLGVDTDYLNLVREDEMDLEDNPQHDGSEKRKPPITVTVSRRTLLDGIELDVYKSSFVIKDVGEAPWLMFALGCITCFSRQDTFRFVGIEGPGRPARKFFTEAVRTDTGEDQVQLIVYQLKDIDGIND